MAEVIGKSRESGRDPLEWLFPILMVLGAVIGIILGLVHRLS